jgi:hypothetical protein
MICTCIYPYINESCIIYFHIYRLSDDLNEDIECHKKNEKNEKKNEIFQDFSSEAQKIVCSVGKYVYMYM